jgi:hypothetical protein
MLQMLMELQKLSYLTGVCVDAVYRTFETSNKDMNRIIESRFRQFVQDNAHVHAPVTLQVHSGGVSIAVVIIKIDETRDN